MSRRNDILERISYLKNRKEMVNRWLTPSNPLMSFGPPTVNHNYQKNVEEFERLSKEIEKHEQELKTLPE